MSRVNTKSNKTINRGGQNLFSNQYMFNNNNNPNMSHMSSNTMMNDDPFSIRKCHNHPKNYSK
jgi:hypothetical protein